MKFNVNQQDLQQALNYCQGVIEKRSTLPILSNILLDVKNSQLTITATDLDLAYYHIRYSPNADDSLGNDLLRDGWDCTHKPVLVDVEVGDIIDGRTRESTMKNLDTNEEWIPVLKVIVSPSLRRCVAQISNYHSYKERSVSAELIL